MIDKLTSELSPAARGKQGIASRFVPFASGLRPFFLLAGIDAIANIGIWLCVLVDPGIWPPAAIAPMYWHAHEMLFGFIAAAIAGFLLTAVPGWTGRGSYEGRPLIALSVLWLFGRVAMIPVVSLPGLAAAVIDLSFFPALAMALAPPLIRARKFRNLPFLFLLLLLFAANLTFHLGALDFIAAGIQAGMALGLDVVCILVVVVGGRIVPAFTRSGLAATGVRAELRSNRLVEYAAIGGVVIMLLADLLIPTSRWNGVIAFVAGISQAARLSQWQGYRAWRVPLIWVLHLGYAWLAAGLLLKGIWFLFAPDFAEKWAHALTIGAFGTMILAVMTRASLGHTGRALMAPQPIALAYLLVSVAGILRTFVATALPNRYTEIVVSAGLTWIAAFLIFLWVYVPILMQPRQDGRPG